VTRSFWAAAALAIVAGLVLLVAAAGGWVSGEEARDMGGVVVTEPTSTPGTRFAPTAVVFGLAGLAGGVLLGVLRGMPRRLAGAVVGLTGLGAVAVVVVGLGRAAGADGILGPAPYAAVAGAVGIAVAGALALRGPARPPARSRYRVEGEQAEDDEWDLATDQE